MNLNSCRASLLWAFRCFALTGLILVALAVSGCTTPTKDGAYVLRSYPLTTPLLPLEKGQEVLFIQSRDTFDCPVTKIADLKIARRTYGSEDAVKKVFRDKARSMRGNAVIGYKFWLAPSGWSWAAPHGEGTVVRTDLDCLTKIRSS